MAKLSLPSFTQDINLSNMSCKQTWQAGEHTVNAELLLCQYVLAAACATQACFVAQPNPLESCAA